MMEKGAVPVAGLRHDVGVGSGGERRRAQTAGVDMMASAIRQDEASLLILAHQTGGLKREGGREVGQINENVVRRSSGALGLGANVGQLLALWIDINHLHLVDDPIARRQEAAARR